MTPKLSRRIARTLLFTVVLIISISSCKDDNDTSTSDRYALTVTAYNAFYWSIDKPKGTLQPAANVSIYASRADYYSKKPYKTATTNADGKAVLNVARGRYFIVAEWQETGKLISSVVPKEDVSTSMSKKGYVAVGLFQTDAEVKNSPGQAYARPGNFKWQDINGDGVINPQDLVELPSASVEVGTTNAEVDIIMGATENSLLTESVSKNNIYDLLNQCATLSYEANKQISTLDIMLSKEAKCTMDSFFGYCDLSNLYILPSNPYLLTATNVLYNIVKKANDVLYYTDYIDIPDGVEKAFLQAEARAFRGYAYLTLATYFGQAGIIINRQVGDNLRIILKTKAEVYSQAKLDLEAAAATNIPAELLQPAYITRNAAMALTARLLCKQKITARQSHTVTLFCPPMLIGLVKPLSMHLRI